MSIKQQEECRRLRDLGFSTAVGKILAGECHTPLEGLRIRELGRGYVVEQLERGGKKVTAIAAFLNEPDADGLVAILQGRAPAPNLVRMKAPAPLIPEASEQLDPAPTPEETGGSRARRCRHCGEAFSVRAGRGLCRACWDDPAIRTRYEPVAAFGGDTRVRQSSPLPAKVPAMPLPPPPCSNLRQGAKDRRHAVGRGAEANCRRSRSCAASGSSRPSSAA